MKFTIEDTISKLIFVEYIMYYRSIENLMRFLFNYNFFQNNLTYASIQINITNNVYVYIEMHIRD